jgi:hypothetical protein
MNTPQKLSLEQLKDAARTLVSTGKNVRAKVHELTLHALSEGQLAKQEIQQTLNTITEGISLGASGRAEEVRAAIADAMQGVDDALANVAEALQLALNEASSHAKDYAEHDLKQGLEELKELEQLFLDTITYVAASASDLVKQELLALSEHARRTGTNTGAQVRMITEELTNRLRATAHDAGAAGKHAAREISLRIASMASSKLFEIADRIQRKADSLKREK